MPIPAPLDNHLQGISTIAYLWKITLIDDTVLGFTDLDIDIPYDGETYKASTGFTATDIDKSGTLSADNVDLEGPFGTVSLEDITRAELFAGRMRGATLEIMVVNYEDLTDGDYILFKGTIGEVRDLGERFEIEVRSYDDKLRQVVGSTIQPLCDAEFADARCGLSAATFTVEGEITAVTDNATFADTTTANITNKPADWFGAGVLTWLTGDNAGIVMDVKSFSAAQLFVLYEAMPGALQVGDTFSVIAGCRKRRGPDCRDKFDNVVNHRGFPDVPGDKFMLTYAQPK